MRHFFCLLQMTGFGVGSFWKTPFCLSGKRIFACRLQKGPRILSLWRNMKLFSVENPEGLSTESLWNVSGENFLSTSFQKLFKWFFHTPNGKYG